MGWGSRAVRNMGRGSRGVSKQRQGFETDQDTCNVQVRYDTQNTRTCKIAGGENYLPKTSCAFFFFFLGGGGGATTELLLGL